MVGRMELELEEDEEDQELKMSDTMSEAAVMLLDKGNLNTLFRIFLLISSEPNKMFEVTFVIDRHGFGFLAPSSLSTALNLLCLLHRTDGA